MTTYEAPVPPIARLHEAQVDFAITHIDPQALGEDFVCVPLAPVQLVLGVRNRHPLRNRRKIRDFLDAEWALPGDDGPTSSTLRLFASLGLPVPTRVIHGDSITAALALVAQMDVVGFFVEPLADDIFKRAGIRRLDLDDALPVMQICVIQRRGSQLTPAALQFIECVKEALVARS
ncbi:hypothetical protein EYW47_35135 [Paraburkholderia silviterrae]|uniref:LysR substrate-binding domain-containing protein n=1 Tax=Paraburkholderia silviterrae TaxID=2528715 RepID=A0A4R5LZY5_9BURK|nr:hypothetical protein EYW47_35135 [Paraburkholderia silviterrae]